MFTWILALVGIVALGAASAVFSAAEMALFSLRPEEAERWKKKHPRCAPALSALLARPRRLSSLLVLGNTLANVPLCLLCLFLLRQKAAAAGDGLLTGAFWPVALLLTAVVVGLCDLLPKMLALRDPEYWVAPVVEALGFFAPVLNPLGAGLEILGERFVGRFLPVSRHAGPALSEEEFESLVALGAETGTLGSNESELIQEILKVGNKTARDVMTPRTDTFTLGDDLSNEEAITQLRTARHHRVPVCGDTPDDVLGILDVRKFLARASAPPGPERLPPYTELLDPPSYVPETMPAPELLRSFLVRPQGMAIVIDEYGGTEGIVTLRDLTEEIVGDALPRGDGNLYIEELDPGRLLVNGQARLEDIAEHARFCSLPLEEGIDTIGGLIFHRLGYVPKTGAVLHWPAERLHLTVRQATRRRVQEVLLEQPDEGSAAGSPLLATEGRGPAPALRGADETNGGESRAHPPGPAHSTEDDGSPGGRDQPSPRGAAARATTAPPGG